MLKPTAQFDKDPIKWVLWSNLQSFVTFFSYFLNMYRIPRITLICNINLYIKLHLFLKIYTFTQQLVKFKIYVLRNNEVIKVLLLSLHPRKYWFVSTSLRMTTVVALSVFFSKGVKQGVALIAFLLYNKFASNKDALQGLQWKEGLLQGITIVFSWTPWAQEDFYA